MQHQLNSVISREILKSRFSVEGKTKIVPKIAMTMIETLHASSTIAILLVTFSIIGAKALIPHASGRFPFLMPNVHPYRVKVFLIN